MIHPTPQGLYIVHLSIHGLIRGHDLELGRDADTGGQTRYVVELCRELARQPGVERVDLLTRRVEDARVSPDYAAPEEILGDRVRIRRITAGPRRYLRKESLWPYLDTFIDQTLLHFRSLKRLPDLIHAHYADAGYVGRALASLLGCPLVFTGHSLGRIKLARLIEEGGDTAEIEEKYRLSQRIEAEELTLEAASLVITSTRQEVREQYEAYHHYAPERMRVIPPGVNLNRFHPPDGSEKNSRIAAEIARFLRDPGKPMVLAIARADERKNLVRLVDAFGGHPHLRERANLVLVAGQRDDLPSLPAGARRVWQDLLAAIDRHDLYGHAAYPKHHQSDDVPVLYRLAAASGGVFVNAALTEPFGLTLLEAAASGLPVVATRDGGPVDIIANCRNGLLVDPLDPGDIGESIHRLLSEPARHRKMAGHGKEGASTHYSWSGHARTYIETCRALATLMRPPTHLGTSRRAADLPLLTRMIFSGLLGTLDGPEGDFAELADFLRNSRGRTGFGLITGRSFDQAREMLEARGLPGPEVLATELGGAIHYGGDFRPDEAWPRHLRFQWEPDRIREILGREFGLHPHDQPGLQGQFKITCRVPDNARGLIPRVRRVLRENKLRAQITSTDPGWLDIIPLRSGKGNTLRYLVQKWGLPPDGILVLARSTADAETILGGSLAVVSSSHDPHLGRFREYPDVYFSPYSGTRALLDGIRHYNWQNGGHGSS
jgi:sucrose-phosphate synthase